jgi:hypothetical protein
MKDEWIVYHDKSPPRADNYLVADSYYGQPYIAHFTKRDGFTDDEGESLDAYITHWQEVPAN